MKRILCALMTVMLLLPFCAAAAEETAGDGYTPVRGTAALYFENGGEGREVRIGDSVFYAADGDTPMVSVNMTVSGVDTANGELRVNGKSAGVKLTAPYRFDVTGLVRDGENLIEAEIYNTLYNHYLTIPTGYNSNIQRSGLIGDVKLIYTNRS